MAKVDRNISPYYDDFDENKRFTKLLFNPGKPIQARELTQIQSLLQNQIDRGSSSNFKNGDAVVSGQISYSTRAHYIKVDTYTFNYTNIDDALGKIFTGNDTGIKAKVIHTEKTINSEPDTIFLQYVGGGVITRLNITSISGTFTADSTVTGVISGATGIVVKHEGIILRINRTNG